jgi:hypothetical protein
MNNFYLLILSLSLLSGCGGSSNSSNKHVDIANYLDSTSLTKQYTNVHKVNGNIANSEYSHAVLVESNLITIKQDSLLYSLITISMDDINFKLMSEENRTQTFKREVSMGDVVTKFVKNEEIKILNIGSQRVGEESKRIEKECVLDALVDEYEVFFYAYKNYDDAHDILKIKCTSKSFVETKIDREYVDSVSYVDGFVESKENISYEYYQKGLGLIAKIDDDCLVSKLPDIIDDNLDKRQCLGERYHYTLYHPQY